MITCRKGDNHSGRRQAGGTGGQQMRRESKAPENKKRRMGDGDELRSLQHMNTIMTSHRYMIFAVEDMTVGDHMTASQSDLRSVRELEKWFAV
jgi:hypothetical protein